MTSARQPTERQGEADSHTAGTLCPGSPVHRAPRSPETTGNDKRSRKYRLITLNELDRALVAANDVSSLAELLKQAKGIHELMRTMDWALEEQNRAAEFRIRVARKLGTHLANGVSRGGRSISPGAKSRRGGTPHPLPEGISRMQSSRLQRLASIPDELFEEYVEERRNKRTSITVASLMRAHGRVNNVDSPNPNKDPQPEGVDGRFEAVYKATRRVMNVEMTVGVPARQLGASEELDSKTKFRERLDGSVFVLAKRGAGAWLDRLALARRAGRIREVVAVLPALVDQPWFQKVVEHRWLCCLLEKRKGIPSPFAAVYHGDRRHAFWLVFSQLGVVLEPPEF